MPQDIVIIGGVALGPKAACRFKRLEPESRVTILDQMDIISYGGCGIPYFISGDISDPGQLQATSFHMLRDEKFFRNVKDVRVMSQTRAVNIDRDKKRVDVIRLGTGEKDSLPYDKLVIATGSRPKRPLIEGRDLGNVFTVSNMEEAIAIKGLLTSGAVEKALIIGAGAIGLEMAEALSDLWEIETKVVEITDQILPGIISKNISQMARQHMEEKGVEFLLDEQVLRLEGDKQVKRAVTSRRSIDTDLVIFAVGVQPNSDLAASAGLDISSAGAIIVNNRMQTSDRFIYAGGDCVEIPNLITGKPGYYPLGSMANRQGRVIGGNLAGRDDTFPGAVGSFVVKLFDISVAGAGLNIASAREQGFDAISALIVQFDRAHFYPEKDLISLELVVEKGSKRVLGIQGLGNTGDGMVGRINTVASLLPHGPTTLDISNMELAYSPPFSAAMDVLNALGNTAENMLDGRNRGLDMEDFTALWNERQTSGVLFLDCRDLATAENFVKKYPDCWKSIPQDELRSRIGELPRDKKLVLICNTGARSYEAQVTLDHMDMGNCYNLQGGMAAVKKSGLDI